MTHLAHDPTKQPDGRTALELGRVLPHTASVNEEGHLCVGGIDLVKFARREGTALYVMDDDDVRMRLRRYRKSLENSGLDAQLVYAGKAFLTRYMAQLVNEEGAWLDVSSGGELHLALAAGFPAAHIIEHGNNKTPSELAEAIDAKVGRIAVDCFEELERLDVLAAERGCVQPIVLRLKPEVIADTHEFVVTGAVDSKFGFGISDGAALQAVLRARQLKHLDLKGLHVHIGSQIFAVDSYARTIETVIAFIVLLRDEYGLLFEEFNLGGGLGIAYMPDDEPVATEEFIADCVSRLKELCAAHGLPLPRFFVEPGRSIVANAGVTLYTVGAIKDLPGVRTYVAIDGGMTDNIRTVLYDAHYEAVIANKAALPRTRIVTLAGKHCESGDVVAIDTALQAPEAGDIVCVFGTGAYCYTMASNYNKQPRPAVFFVRDGRERLVVRRETYDDLLNCDII